MNEAQIEQVEQGVNQILRATFAKMPKQQRRKPRLSAGDEMRRASSSSIQRIPVKKQKLSLSGQLKLFGDTGGAADREQ